MSTSLKGNNMQLTLLLVTSILLSGLTSAQQESDAVDSSAEIDQQWKNFKVKFGKSYATTTEETFRKKIFFETLKEIEAHNALYSEGISSYTTGINQFSDMEDWEFTEMMTCVDETGMVADSTIVKFDPISKSIPAEIDWRKEAGHVTAVQDQKECGACWAFAAAGALEALKFRTTKTSQNLSEQHLVDCSSGYGNKGCNGGRTERAFAYVIDEGITSEESYPYDATNSTCRRQSNQDAYKCDNFKNIINSETDILTFVGSTGPIAVNMVAPASFKSYALGVYDNETDCNGTLNHSALIVGYGTDNSTGEDYWIIKNSLGTSWGTEGYIYIVRDKQMCGIGQFAAYPVLNDSTSSSCYRSASVTFILFMRLCINFFIVK